MTQRTSLHVIFVIATLFVCVWISAGGFGIQELRWPEIDTISIASLGMFGTVCFIGMLNERYYLIFLIFVIVGFPTAVNNFFPGAFLGSQSEIGASIFPILTHIDIYLLLGIIRFSRNKFDQSVVRSAAPVAAVLILMVVSFIINLAKTESGYEGALLAVGTFQTRYLILIFFLLLVLKEKSISAIAIGLSISIFFLFAESIVFTFINKLPRLSSGSLATNTFGNIMAQIGLLLFFHSRRYRRSSVMGIYFSISAFTGVLMAASTGTRMSIISAILVCLIAWAYKRLSFFRILRVTAVLSIIVIAVIKLDLHNQLPPKYQVWNIVSWRDVQTIMHEPGAMTSAVERTPESSSIITRFQLYRTSFKMIEENPLWGIGAGRWNYLKTEYGFDIPVLLDSHNGYLAILSQFGIIGGLGLIFFLLFTPSKSFLQQVGRQRDIASSGIWMLGIISLGMTICEVSNAGVFKPQVFGLLTLIAIIFLSQRRVQAKENLDKHNSETMPC
jgi:hypothetical protein